MKKVTAVALVLCLAVVQLCGCGKSSEKEVVKVRLNEVAYSIFYAPQYVAIENGYFEWRRCGQCYDGGSVR